MWIAILPLDRPSGGSAITLETQEVLFVVEIAERLPEEEKLFAEIHASKELDERRKTPEQKGANSTTVRVEENLSLKEQVRKLTEQVQLLMTSSQERGAARSAESSSKWQKLTGRTQ